MKQHIYTDEEKSLVEKLYPTGDSKKLAKQLGISVAALCAMAAKWEIRKKVNSWTPEKIEYFKSNYGKLPAPVIAKHLQLSISSLVQKAMKLKITARKWKNYETAYLKKVYAKGGTKAFLKKYPGKSPSTISAKARALGLQKYHNFSRTVWTKKQIKLLQRNYGKMSYGELAKLLNKTKSAVEHRAYELGLTSKTKYSNLEILIGNFLQGLSVKVEPQYKISKYRVDYVVNDNIAIEINGTYWHCDKRKYPKPKNLRQERALKSDKCKYKFLKSQGYRLVILWEIDINNDFSRITNSISAVINGDIDEYNSAKSVKTHKSGNTEVKHRSRKAVTHRRA